MRAVLPVLLFVALVVGDARLPAFTSRPSDPSDLVVHEWGTFTTVAGPDGKAMQWLPLGGPSDLPCFVEFYKNRLFKVLLTSPPASSGSSSPTGATGAPLDYFAAKAGLKGTVRMETPVLYFYAPQAIDVSVSVRFSQGLFSEWYPTADVVQPPALANVLTTPAGLVSSIAWPKVSVRPGTRPRLPMGRGPSHYYAARETDADPIQVNGQDERFLFYRGVGGFPVPVSATFTESGGMAITNLGQDALPYAIAFSNENGKIRYRVHSSVKGTIASERPAEESDLASLRRELERILIAEGLYPREAAAMVNTWRDTWFEEGVRVFYIVPASTVETILPLTINPKPAATARAFVGRMDVITPAEVASVRRAVALGDRQLLAKHGRLLGPIADRLLETTPSEEQRARVRTMLSQTFASYVTQVETCD